VGIAGGFLPQFYTHYAYEGRQPALFDSLSQSIVLAPLFVWLESVIFPLGLFPDVHTKVKTEVQKNLDKWEADGKWLPIHSQSNGAELFYEFTPYFVAIMGVAILYRLVFARKAAKRVKQI